MVVTIVTTNPERAALLGACVRELGHAAEIVTAELGEPQADSVASVARAKAAAATRLVEGPVLVEDSGLAIPALGGFPGPYLKYVLATLGAQRLVELGGGMACRFESAIALGENILELAIAGTIATTLAPGTAPDLWRLLVPAGETRPFAELDAARHLGPWRAQITSWLRARL